MAKLRRQRNRPSAKRPPPARTAELTVTALGAQGDGIADMDGAPVFLPLTLPGDRVRARVSGERGAVTEFLDKAERMAPACPHFGACGGCTLQHVPVPAYRDWKRQRVIDALAKKGFGEIDVAEALVSPPHSRRRATLAFRNGKSARIGYHGRRSHEIVDISECPILARSLEALIAPLRELLAELSATAGKVMLTVTDSGVDMLMSGVGELSLRERESLAAFATERDLARISVCAGNEPESRSAEAVVMRRQPVLHLGGADVPLPAAAFLQATRQGQTALTNRILEWSSGETVVDLFCGCGTFALPLSERFGVHAVDGDEPLITALDRAIRSVPGRQLRTERRDLLARPFEAGELRAFDSVIFDPPRAGAKAQAEQLAASGIATIVAVSCNPATFARDARILAEGGYRLATVQPVDQFLWSAHVELAALFKRSQ